MATAILAIQGDFAEHARTLNQLGEPTYEIRSYEGLSRPFDRLVLPGGESTVQGRLLRELGLMGPLRDRIEDGMPVLATCAGLILLAQRVEGDGSRAVAPRPDQRGPWLATLDVTVERNAYGRQLGSFHAQGTLERDAKPMQGAGEPQAATSIPMTFIRAPRITRMGPNVNVLARTNDQVVGVRQHNQLALAFHPELDYDPNVFELFLSL